jgi:hypothetical protein
MVIKNLYQQIFKGVKVRFFGFASAVFTRFTLPLQALKGLMFSPVPPSFRSDKVNFPSSQNTTVA